MVCIRIKVVTIAAIVFATAISYATVATNARKAMKSPLFGKWKAVALSCQSGASPSPKMAVMLPNWMLAVDNNELAQFTALGPCYFAHRGQLKLGENVLDLSHSETLISCRGHKPQLMRSADVIVSYKVQDDQLITTWHESGVCPAKEPYTILFYRITEL